MKSVQLLATAIVGACLLALPAFAQETGSGSWPALYEEDAGLADHVIYRPADLNSLGSEKMGIYVFGNGACSADGLSSANHLLEVASHGYVAVAPGFIPAQHPDRTTGSPPGQMGTATRPEQLTQAIDWLIAESSRTGSPYFGRIDTSKIAVSGFSCGGLQALMVAPDPRIKTLVIMNSGIFKANNPLLSLPLDKTQLGRLHGSVIYVMGGATDIAYDNGTDDYQKIGHIPAALVNIPVGHGGTYMDPHGGIGAEVVVHWLDWQLKGDAAAGAWFTGPDCGFCTDTRLTYESKNLP